MSRRVSVRHRLSLLITSIWIVLAPFPYTAPVDAQDAPHLQVLQTGRLEPVAFSIAQDLHPPPAFEQPPALAAGPDGGSIFFVTTGWSWLCHAARNVLEGGASLTDATCARFSVPERIGQQTGAAISPAQVHGEQEDWRLSYYGATSLTQLNGRWGKDAYAAALHGENKNERVGDTLYANTLDTSVSPESCASGYSNGQYQDCSNAYNAFVSLTLFDGTSGSRRDLGPILWPAAGYVANGKKLSSGLQNPNLIEAGQYLYIYYRDTSISGGGLHVARIAKADPDAPGAVVAIPYFNGSFAADNRSLPAGFSKAAIRRFYASPGGRASELWPDSWQTFCFVVARLRGTPFYLGVEEYGMKTDWGIRLRVSRDLVHWSTPVPVPGLTAKTWADGALHYPRLADLTGNEASIDPAGFYILGSTNHATVVREHVAIVLR